MCEQLNEVRAGQGEKETCKLSKIKIITGINLVI